jgi:hypothetical protein
MVQALTKQIDIGADDLAEKLAAFKLSASTLKTMSYHSRDTIKAMVKLGLLKS